MGPKLDLMVELLKKHEIILLTWLFINAITVKVQNQSAALKKVIQFRKYECIKRYLRKNYKDIIDKYNAKCRSMSKQDIDTISNDSPIWVFWAQGQENMPYPVNLCIKSIIKFSREREVYILDLNNYKEYVALPDYIEKKLKLGIISYAHFADVLRLALLKEYGGIWIDSTFYMCNAFPEEITEYPFYSINQNGERNWVVTKDKWSIGLLASHKNNILIDFWYEFILKYWENEIAAIAYLFSDCLLAIGYEDIPYIREMINNIPVNNLDAFVFISEFRNKSADEDVFGNLIKNNFLFQTTYKQSYNVETGEGQKTYFGRLIEY